MRQPEVVCISGEKPSLKGEHWCQESWMANDKRRPPFFQLGHDRSREVPTCPKRSRHVPTSPGQPCQSCQASSESPIDSPLNSSPCPDANSVKSCRDRSYKLVYAAHHHQSFLRGTWSCRFSTVTSQSRSPDLHFSVLPLWSLCCGIGDTGRPKKCRENAQTRN